jgi:ankyrin repeat protein
MADSRTIKRRLKMILWFLTAGILFGIFAMWNAKSMEEIAPGENQFLLAASITGGLVLAWIGALFSLLGVHLFLEPNPSRKPRKFHLPFWIVKVLFLLISIVVLAIFLRRLSLKTANEFTLFRKNRISALREFVEQNPEALVRKDAKTGKTLLELALDRGNAPLASMLLKRGAELDLGTNAPNWVIIHMQNLPMLEVLLEYGADPDRPDSAGALPIHYAVASQNTNALLKILEAGAEVDARDPNYRTPLMIATLSDDLGSVQILLEHGADPNRWDRMGETALHLAVRRGNSDAIDLLFSYNENPSALNFDGLAPVHLAAIKGDIPIIKQFLKNAPQQINLPSKKGLTPFEYALRRHQYETAKFLLSQGVDINHHLPTGQTPLHLMLAERDYNAAKFLIEEGADVEIPDSSGETPRYFMRKKKLNILLDLLQEETPSEETNRIDRVNASIDPSEKP